MNLTSTEEIESKTIPGVKFTLRRLTDAARNEIRQEVLEHYERVDELHEEAQPLAEAIEATENVDEKKSLRAEIKPIERDILRINYEHIDPAYLRKCLVSTTLVVDDTPINAVNLHSLAPSAFCNEVWGKVRSYSILGVLEVKNFELPTTSQEPAQ